MTEQDKQLLLKDLCARLPYGVKVQFPDIFNTSVVLTETLTCIDNGHINDCGIPIEYVKPYLRPMSSMTEDEKKEFRRLFKAEIDIDDKWGHSVSWNTGTSDEYVDVYFSLSDMGEIITWLNKKMFDWCSMISKGLALEAPEGMYNK